MFILENHLHTEVLSIFDEEYNEKKLSYYQSRQFYQNDTIDLCKISGNRCYFVQYVTIIVPRQKCLKLHEGDEAHFH